MAERGALLSDRYTLKQYIRQVERYGVEDLYEVARDDLTPRELVMLVARMRRVDAERREAEVAGNVRHRIEPAWTLPREDARELVGRLKDPVDAKWVAGLLGISRQTVRSYRQAALEAAESVENGDPGVPGHTQEAAA